MKQDSTVAVGAAILPGELEVAIRKALSPLPGESHLSKSAISRIVWRLKASFAAWSTRDLSEESYAVLYRDAIYLPVRLARRVVKVPVQVVPDVREGDGQKVAVAMQLVTSKSTASWIEVVRSPGERHLADPHAVVADGAKGLLAAMPSPSIRPSVLLRTSLDTPPGRPDGTQDEPGRTRPPTDP